uniref:DNA methyltransferase 1-associated protein 1 n=1 Tax=Romanomermis culicivorax TaxID=13658 RepID=A0A915HZ93_ROMCU
MINDVQDILEVGVVPESAATLTKENLLSDSRKKQKRAEPGLKKPEGMHREVYNLLINDKNDVVPLVPSAAAKMGGYKNVKARLGMRKVRPWRWTKFANPARKDNLQLSHWHRVEEEEEDKPYPFAKFNKVLEIKYPNTEEIKTLQYADDNWSQAELEHLFDLCSKFDLRWPIVHDRFDSKTFKNRSMEDLKDKFYNVSNQLIKAAAPTDSEPALMHFDAQHERLRKEQLKKLWNRTEKHVEEEEMLVDELQRIEARKKERARKAKDLQKLISAVDRAPAMSNTSGPPGTGGSIYSSNQYPPGLQPPKKKFYRGPSSSTTSIEGLHGMQSSFFKYVDVGAVVRFPEFKSAGPHLRSQCMKMPSTLGQRKLKAIDVALDKLGLEHHPMAVDDVVTQFNDLRSDLMLLYELKLALTTCQYDLETLKHQYQSTTNKELTIPVHLRIVPDLQEMDAQASPFKRRISDAMEVNSGPVVVTGTVHEKAHSLVVTT